MKQILIPIDIDSQTWAHLLGHVDSGVVRDEMFVWFDITSADLTKYLLVFSKRDNLDWFPGFYTQFIEIVPSMVGIDIFRFITPLAEYIFPGSMDDKVVF